MVIYLGVIKSLCKLPKGYLGLCKLLKAHLGLCKLPRAYLEGAYKLHNLPTLLSNLRST
jgi:hypothetical protein